MMSRMFSRFSASMLRSFRESSARTFKGSRGFRTAGRSFALMKNVMNVRSHALMNVSVPVVLGLAVSVKCKGLSDEELIKKADELYQSNEVDQLYELLKQSADSVNSEVLWRLARATCDKAKSSGEAEVKKSLMYEAFSVAERALEIGRDKSYACHKWYAIMLDYIGEYQGTKERISRAYDIKEHFLKAVELNPRDATSIHLIGYWCFVFADLPWYQKKVASVLFATPPSSTYDEALEYFLQAEKIDPYFYSMNLLMLGRCYIKKSDKDKARQYLEKAKDYPVRTEDDKRANKEATELLKSL